MIEHWGRNAMQSWNVGIAYLSNFTITNFTITQNIITEGLSETRHEIRVLYIPYVMEDKLKIHCLR